MTEAEIETLFKDERSFLHDLASPLGTAILLADALLENMQSKGTDPDEVMQMGQIYEALELLKSLISKRKDVLIKKGGA